MIGHIVWKETEVDPGVFEQLWNECKWKTYLMPSLLWRYCILKNMVARLPFILSVNFVVHTRQRVVIFFLYEGLSICIIDGSEFYWWRIIWCSLIFGMHKQIFIISVAAISSSVRSGYICHCHSSHGNAEAVSVASCKRLLYISYGDLV